MKTKIQDGEPLHDHECVDCKPTPATARRHTPTPWHVEHTDDGYIRINNENGDLPVEDSGNGRHPMTVSLDDAAFIVRAVNAHEEYETAMKTAIKDIENGSLGNALSVLRWAMAKQHKADVTCLPDCKIETSGK